MKELVKKLENSLGKKSKTLEITGKELMELFDISFDQISKLCEKNRIELYDNFDIETSPKYAKELRKKFEFNGEVYWYLTKGDMNPKYITIGMDRVYTSCSTFLTNVFLKGDLSYYSAELIKYINILCDMANEEEIRLTLKYLEDLNLDIYFQNKQITKIKYECLNLENLPNFDKEAELMLLYQLIILSYNVSIEETLKTINLI